MTDDKDKDKDQSEDESQLSPEQDNPDEDWLIGYDWEEDEPDEEFQPVSGLERTLRNFMAVLVIVAFVLFSFSSYQYLVDPRYKFLDESGPLQSEAVVHNSEQAIVYLVSFREKGNSQGTGFIISSDGRLLTNLHVVEGASAIRATLYDGRSFVVTSYEPIEGADAALLRLNGSDLPSLPVDQSRLPAPGEKVTLIGNPLGLSWMAGQGTIGSYYTLGDQQGLVFDINATVNHGNSGSPVIDENGRAVGMIFAMTSPDKNNNNPKALAIPLSTIIIPK